MTDINQFHDSLNIEPPSTKKIPDMLNVLTILTFIGCAFFFLSYIYSYFTVCKSVEMMQKMSETGAEGPMAGMMGDLSETMVKQCELRLPVLIIGVSSLLVCFLGALQMRKLKKAGFFLYIIGEIAAPIASIVIMGSGTFGAFALLGMIFPIVFIILYATQLKHMK